MRAVSVLLLTSLPLPVSGHGVMTYPPTSRQNGSLATSGDCYNGECKWFSEFVFIPGEPTLNDARFRSMSVDISNGPHDWTRRHPWRAPGSAPVWGSGCGSAGGGPEPGKWSGGNIGLMPEGIEQGTDGLTLAAKEPHTWHRGGNATVAWALRANHGGGYSWRLCKKSDDPAQVNEACFQRTPLRFARDTHRIQYRDYFVTMDNDPVWQRQIKMPDIEIPMAKVTDGTHPPGSEWARNPIPSCKLCTDAELAGCGEYMGGDEPPDSIGCLATCAGGGLSVCPPGGSMFEPPAPGLAAHFMGSATKVHAAETVNMDGFGYSIVDEVIVPDHLEAGDYLLSWRWDCEESPQVWQNCADVRIVDHASGGEMVSTVI